MTDKNPEISLPAGADHEVFDAESTENGLNTSTEIEEEAVTVHPVVPVAVHPEQSAAFGGLSSNVRRDQKRFVNPAVAYLQSLTSQNSRNTMASKLNVVARMTNAENLMKCDWSSLTPEAVLTVMTNLEGNGHSAATVNCYLSALKGVAKASWLSGLMDHETYLRIKEVKQRRFHRLPTGRSLTYSETSELVSNCNPESAAGARDRAILLLMIGCGLRRGEVPNLQLDALDLSTASLTLVGKGDKQRRVFLPDPVANALLVWIKQYRGFEKGCIFGRIYKNGRISLSSPMSARSVGDILAKHMLHVDSTTDYSGNKLKTTSHDLRRTFATRLLDDNVDIVTVKNMMGHANVTTTAQYDRRGEDAQRNASKRVRI